MYWLLTIHTCIQNEIFVFIVSLPYFAKFWIGSLIEVWKFNSFMGLLVKVVSGMGHILEMFAYLELGAFIDYRRYFVIFRYMGWNDYHLMISWARMNFSFTLRPSLNLKFQGWKKDNIVKSWVFEDMRALFKIWLRTWAKTSCNLI